MSEKVNRAKIRLSPDDVKRFLYLPETARVYGCQWDFARDDLILYVEDSQLPAHPLGIEIPFIVPKYTRQAPLVFDWDIKQILNELID